MTTFYDENRIMITDRWLHIGDQRYAIDKLHNLRSSRGPADSSRLHIATTACLALTVLGLIITARAGPAPSVLVLALVTLAGLAVARARRRSRLYLLWADYHGGVVLLFRTQDHGEFGKVSRALLRASTHGRTAPQYIVYVTPPTERPSAQQAITALPPAGDPPVSPPNPHLGQVD